MEIDDGGTCPPTSVGADLGIGAGFFAAGRFAQTRDFVRFSNSELRHREHGEI
jgi:hypothetical protein